MTVDPAAALRALLDAAISSAQPAICIPPALPAPPDGRTIVVGFGKAAASMARAVEDHYTGPVTGVVVAPHGSSQDHGCRSIQVLEAGHPIADDASVTAAKAIMAAVSGLTANDLVLILISGGGSALFEWPRDGVSLSEMQAVVRQLMHAGASIGELNTVRATLSRVKGGGLARAIGSARAVALVISDVVGDDIAVIASGPAVAPPDLRAAPDILARYGVDASDHILRVMARAARAHDLTPAIPHHLIATPAMALAAAASVARNLGLKPIVLGDDIEGTPDVAADLHLQAAARLQPGEVLLSGGELVCRVTGEGRGGPNLAFCLELLNRQADATDLWALACDTDGRDGNSGLAGAMVRPGAKARAQAEALDIASFRVNADSLGLFRALADTIDTGWTGTNVNDFRAILRAT